MVRMVFLVEILGKIEEGVVDIRVWLGLVWLVFIWKRH